MYPVNTRETLFGQAKLIVRCILATILFYSGLNSLYRFFARKHQVIPLMYHRIVNQGDLSTSYIQSGMYVTVDVFEMHMKYLSENYHVITMDEFISHMTSGIRFKNQSCLITFDDGWYDNYIHAFPILKKYNLPATIFLVSGYVGTHDWLWPDIVSYLVVNSIDKFQFEKYRSYHHPYLKEMRFFDMIGKPYDTLDQKIEMIIEVMKHIGTNEREKAIAEMKSISIANRVSKEASRVFLDWPEVIEMSKKNISFGSHTKTHLILTQVSDTSIDKEVLGSKSDIENYLSSSCTAFAYPNGCYNSKIKQFIMKHFGCAFSTNYGSVSHTDDPFTLNRVGIHNDITYTKPLFACRISGILSSLGL